MAVITRTKDIHPEITVSERDCSFVGDKTISLKTKNCDEAYYYFNGDASGRQTIDGEAEVQLADHVVNGSVDLTVYLSKGVNVFEQTFTYRQLELAEGGFNVLGLDPKYLNDQYELYIWSWNPGRWSKDYEIRDGVLLVDTTGMTGFLVAVFEKGYEIKDPANWDPNVIKQSSDIKGDLLKQGFIDLSGF